MGMLLAPIGENIIIKTEPYEVESNENNLPDSAWASQPGVGEVVSVGGGVPEAFRTEVTVGCKVRFNPRGTYGHGENLVSLPYTSILSVEIRDVEVEKGQIVERLQTSRERVAAFRDISGERDYQDEKWGGKKHDDTAETQATWVGYINEYAGGTGRAEKYDFRTRMVKAAALAVAAIESHDRKVEELALASASCRVD